MNICQAVARFTDNWTHIIKQASSLISVSKGYILSIFLKITSHKNKFHFPKRLEPNYSIITSIGCMEKDGDLSNCGLHTTICAITEAVKDPGR